MTYQACLRQTTAKIEGLPASNEQVRRVGNALPGCHRLCGLQASITLIVIAAGLVQDDDRAGATTTQGS